MLDRLNSLAISMVRFFSTYLSLLVFIVMIVWTIKPPLCLLTVSSSKTFTMRTPVTVTTKP